MDKRIVFIRNYILFNLESDLNAENLAIKSKMSPDHLGKLFKAQTGESLMRFVKNARLEKVKEILESDEGRFEKISHVYSRVGCTDPRNLTNDFREKFGMTPSEFQKQSWDKLAKGLKN